MVTAGFMLKQSPLMYAQPLIAASSLPVLISINRLFVRSAP